MVDKNQSKYWLIIDFPIYSTHVQVAPWGEDTADNKLWIPESPARCLLLLLWVLPALPAIQVHETLIIKLSSSTYIY